MYLLLDKFFFVFHSAIILVVLFGWTWKRTRLIGLVIIFLTAFSWTVLGIWYGFGFCPFTQWHWDVRAKLGIHDMPSSYTKFLIDSLTGLDVSEKFVDTMALVLLILAFVASVYSNLRDWRKKRQRERA